ncbi:hypothetical protein K438DRAFT_1764853 [Mycena galopus ATCC 62051]|nr:hypothetical protein K438DRAFT_1764853 [Mycena galopus ATCC 62051]
MQYKAEKEKMTRGYSSKGSLRVKEISECEPVEIEIDLRDSPVGANKTNEKDTPTRKKARIKSGLQEERRNRLGEHTSHIERLHSLRVTLGGAGDETAEEKDKS